MNLFRYYRTRTRRRLLPLFALCLTAAVILLLRCGVVTMLQGPVPLYGVPAEELEGAYVTVEVPYLYATYAQTLDESGEIISVEFIMDANRDQFMGLKVSGEEIDAALVLRQGSVAYETSGELPQTITVTGTIEPLLGPSLELYDAVLGNQLSQEETDGIMLPLVLNAGTIGGLTPLWCWVLFAGGLVCLALALLVLVRMFGKGKAKKLVKQAKALRPDAPDVIVDRAEALYTEMKGAFGCDGELVLYAGERDCWLLPAATVCWAYIRPRGSGWQLVLCRFDGTQVCQKMTLHQAQQAMAVLGNRQEDLALGYHPALAQAWQRDPEAVVNVARNLKENGISMMYGPKK